MSRAVYIGGFLNGRASAYGVQNALGKHFENVDVFTFSDFVNDPEGVHRAMKNAPIFTHSAGALALTAASPERAILLNAPLPTSIGRLALRSVKKTARMYSPHGNVSFKEASAYSRSSLGELAAHPFANLRKLREIADFDAVTAARQLRQEGIKSHLVWTHQDAFFQPSNFDLGSALESSIPVTMLSGEHDEAVLHPEGFFEELLASIG